MSSEMKESECHRDHDKKGIEFVMVCVVWTVSRLQYTANKNKC